MRETMLFILLAGVTAFGASTPTKKRVAILDFDNPALQTATSGDPYKFMTSAPILEVDVGKMMADLLVNALVRDGSCTVIERRELDKVLKEQNLSNSDRVDPSTAARLGRILGVDAIIVGSVTRYDHSDRTTGHGHSYGGFHVSHASKHDVKADVQITARVVSPDTAEIVAVAQGSAESERKGIKEDYEDQYYGKANPAADIAAEATNKAITDLAAKLEQDVAALPARKHSVDAVVADVNPSRIVINAGTMRGVKIGDHLEIWRSGKPIRDPETGKVLRYDDQRLGDAVVTDTDESSAGATYTASDAVHIGDHVRSPEK